MNAEEVLSLLRHAVRHYLAPSTIRPNESEEEASVRQNTNLRELLEELRRYVVISPAAAAASAAQLQQQMRSGGAAAGKSATVAQLQKKPTVAYVTLPSANAFHHVCLSIAYDLVAQRRYRQALNTGLSSFADSLRELEPYLDVSDTPTSATASDDKDDGAVAVATTAGTNGNKKEAVLMHQQQLMEWDMLDAVSRFYLLLESDPNLDRSSSSKENLHEEEAEEDGSRQQQADTDDGTTLHGLEAQLRRITAGMQRMLAVAHGETHYHLLYNSTVFLFSCCKELVRLSCHAVAAPYFAFCGRVMDAVIPLATVKYLPWRIRLFHAAGLCYEALRDVKGAAFFAQHALKIAEDLQDLEMSDVVPPSREVQLQLQSCLEQTRARVLVSQWRCQAAAVAAAADGTAASPSPVAPAAKGSGAAATGKGAQDAQKKKDGGASATDGGASNGGAAGSGAPIPPLPNTPMELIDAVLTYVFGGLSQSSLTGSTPAAMGALRRLLDVLQNLAVDVNTRWIPLPAVSNAPVVSPSDALGELQSNPADQLTAQLRSMAADAIAQFIQPMVDSFIRQHPSFVKQMGWPVSDAGPRPGTQDGTGGAEVAASAKPAGKAPGGKPGGKKAAASSAADGAGGAAGGASPSNAGASASATSLDVFMIQAPMSPAAMAQLLKALFASNALSVEPLGGQLSAPTALQKLVAVIDYVAATPEYTAVVSATFASQSADQAPLKRVTAIVDGMIRVKRAFAAACVLAAAAAQSTSTQAQAQGGAAAAPQTGKSGKGATGKDASAAAAQQQPQAVTTPVGQVLQLPANTFWAEVSAAPAIELIRSACVFLATKLYSDPGNKASDALTELLACSLEDLVEDSARFLCVAFQRLPTPSEQPGSVDVFEAAAYALIRTAFPDVIMIGNLTLTVSRLLQQQSADQTVQVVEGTIKKARSAYDMRALRLVRACESFLSTRQAEFVYNHDHTGTQRNSSCSGDVVPMEKAATLTGSLWLRTLRDIRTLLLQTLAALRLKLAASDLHHEHQSEHERQLQTLQDRENRVHLYGELSRKERRVLELCRNVELEPPTTAPQMERKLVAWAAKSGADDAMVALVWIEIAKCQPTAALKRERLQNALDALVAAQAAYDRDVATLLKLNAAYIAKSDAALPQAEGESDLLPAHRPGTAEGGVSSVAFTSAALTSRQQHGATTDAAAISQMHTPRVNKQQQQRSAGTSRAISESKPQQNLTPNSVASPHSSGNNGGGHNVAPFSNDATLERTTATGTSIYLVWSLYVEACATCEQSHMCRGAAEETLAKRFVVCGDDVNPGIWDVNLFAIDVLHSQRCNVSSHYLCMALAKAFTVICEVRMSDTPFIPEPKYNDPIGGNGGGSGAEDSGSMGFDTRRHKFIEVQRNFARCGNLALLALELAAAVDDQPSMTRIAHLVFNTVLPLITPRSAHVMALRPLTMLFHIFTLLEDRRWSDGPLQFLAARTIKATLAMASQLSAAAQGPVIRAALRAFQHVYPLVLRYPNLRQRRHMDDVIRQMKHLDNVANTKMVSPANANAPGGASGAAAGADGSKKGGAAAAAPPPKPSKGGAAAGAAGGAPAVIDGSPFACQGRTTLYLRSELFFDDLLPVEYLELLDLIMWQTPGGSIVCEAMEAKFVPWSSTASNSNSAHASPPAAAGAEQQQTDGSNGAPPRRAAFTVRREPKTLFPPILLQVVGMWQANVHPTIILAKLNEFKGTDPFYSKTAAALAMELLSRRQDEFATQVATEAIREIRSRHENLTWMKTESLRQLRDFLASIGHVSGGTAAPGNDGGTSVSAYDRLLQKVSRRVSEIRRRMAFKRLRGWFLQYDVPFQALLNFVLMVCVQREAERARAMVLAQQQQQQTTGVSSAQTTPQTTATGPAPKIAPPKGKAAAAAAALAAANAEASQLSPEEKMHAVREELARYACKAMVLFNRCYRAQYASLTLQVFVNALRSLVALEPPSALADVLAVAKASEHGLSSARSGGANNSAHNLMSASTASPSPTNGGGGGFHLTISQAATKATSEALQRLEPFCKTLATEVLRLLHYFADGLINAATELECLQPVAVKRGDDTLLPNGIVRRSTSLQMWLTEEGRFEDRRRDLQEQENAVLRSRVLRREQDEFIESENWDRVALTRQWAKGFLEAAKSCKLVDEDADTIDGIIGADDLSSAASSSGQQSSNTLGGLGGGGEGPRFDGVTLANGSRRRKQQASIVVKKRQDTSPQPTVSASVTPAFESAEEDGSSGGGAGGGSYQPLAYQARLGKHISLDELIRCFMYLVRCLQYGQRKRSAVSMTLEVNDLTKHHFATTLLPFAMNVQNAMGVSIDKTMALYSNGYRGLVRTEKLILEARRALAAYKETDAYRRAQLKLATTLMPSKRGAVVTMQQDIDTMSVGTSGTGTSHGNGAGVQSAGGGHSYKDVVASFNTAIAYLRQKHSTLRLVAVLYELGHLHLHHRVKAEAERCWNDVADAAFSQVNSVKNWREVLTSLDDSNNSPDGVVQGTTSCISSEDLRMLESLGVHKALMCACALSSLAAYLYQENQKRATDCCLFAAEVLRACIVSSSSITAPQRKWDHASHTVREIFVNCQVASLYSEILPTMAHGLLYAAHHLSVHQFPQQSVFIANVVEFLAVEHLRSKELAVFCRLLKARGAAACGDFRSAFSIMEAVALGRTLPDACGGSLGQTIDLSAEVTLRQMQGAASGGTDAASKKGGGGAAAAKGAVGKVATDASDASAAGAGDGSLADALLLGGGGSTASNALAYDNSKPPSCVHNFKVVDTLLHAIFPNLAAVPLPGSIVAANAVASNPALAAASAGVPSPAGVMFAEHVAAEYGGLLVRQTLLTMVHVLEQLAGTEAVSAWAAANESANAEAAAANAANAKGKGDKGGAAGGKGAGDKGAVSTSAAATVSATDSCGAAVATLALNTADRIIAALQSLSKAFAAPPTAANAAASTGNAKAPAVSAKDAAAAAAASASAAPPVWLIHCYSLVEDLYMRQMCKLHVAQLASLRGNAAAAVDLLKQWVAAHNTGDSFALSIPNVPSFTVASTGRTLCDVFSLMAKNALWMRRWDVALESVQQGLQIAAQCGDSYASREFELLRMVACLRQGRSEDALEVVETLMKLTTSTDFKPKASTRYVDGMSAQAQILRHLMHATIVEEPRLHQLNVLLPKYDAQAQVRVRELLRAAVDVLLRRARDLGLNTYACHPSETSTPPAAPASIGDAAVGLQKIFHNNATYDAHCAINVLSRVLVHCGLLQDAEQLLRFAIDVSTQYDNRRLPHERIVSQLQLASVLRQAYFGAIARPAASHLPTERPLSTGVLPSVEQSIASFFHASNQSSSNHPSSHVEREIVDLLLTVIDSNIRIGHHDYEILRLAFNELAVITAQYPLLCNATTTLLALANLTSQMQRNAVHNTAVFGASNVVAPPAGCFSAAASATSAAATVVADGTNGDGGASVVSLPAAIYALAEDFAMRDAANQKIFQVRNAELWQQMLASGNATGGGGGKNGGGGANAASGGGAVPLAAQPTPVVVTVPVIVSIFMLLQRERDTVGLLGSTRATIDELLVRVRQFLQSKTLPFSFFSLAQDLAAAPGIVVNNGNGSGASASTGVTADAAAAANAGTVVGAATMPVLFDRTPRMVVPQQQLRSAQSSSAAGVAAMPPLPKANFVFTQCLVSNTSSPTVEEVDGESRPALPAVSLLWSVSSVTDRDVSFSLESPAAAALAGAAGGAKATAAGGKGGAAAGSKGGAAAAAAPTQNSNSGSPQIVDDLPVPMPITLLVPLVPQAELTAIHLKAKGVLRQQLLKDELQAVTLDETLADAMAAAIAGGAGGGTGGKGEAKGKAAPAAASAASGASDAAASMAGGSLATITGLTPRFSDASTSASAGPTDEDKSQLLLSFVELLVGSASRAAAFAGYSNHAAGTNPGPATATATSSLTAGAVPSAAAHPSSLDAFFPPSALTAEHLAFIAAVTNVHQGCASVQSVEVHRWALKLADGIRGILSAGVSSYV